MIKSTIEPYIVTLDDDVTVPKLISKFLNYPNRAYATADQLLNEAKTLKPIMAFVDIHLGVEGTGLELIPELQHLWPHAPIIVITGNPSSQSIRDALAAGADDIIRKPFDPVEFDARAQCRIRKSEQLLERLILKHCDFALDTASGYLSTQAKKVYLSRLESQLLAHLVRKKGVLEDKATLKRILWGNLKVSDNALNRKIHLVRRALQDVESQVRLEVIYRQGVFLKYIKN